MGFRQVLGLTLDEAQAGVVIANMPEQDPGAAIGVGPVEFEVFCNVHGLVHSNPSYILATEPWNLSASGSDNQGEMGVTADWVNTGDDINYTGPTALTFTNGFFQTTFIAFLNAPHNIGITVDFTVIYDPTDISTYTTTLVDDPTNLHEVSHSLDPIKNQGTLTFSFDYTNHGEDPIGFAVKRDGVVVGSIPSAGAGSNSYTYTDSVDSPSGTYTYTVSAYRYSDTSVSDDSNPISIDFGGAVVPDIDVTGSGGISFGGNATIVFVADASGLYTLVVGKTNDTLYDRNNNSTQDVKIPDPFAKTGFIGG